MGVAALLGDERQGGRVVAAEQQRGGYPIGAHMTDDPLAEHVARHLGGEAHLGAEPGGGDRHIQRRATHEPLEGQVAGVLEVDQRFTGSDDVHNTLLPR